MEGSAYTERTLQLVYRWHDKFSGVGTVIQSYLRRSEKDIEELNRRKIRVRLCKGAYKEPHSVAFQSKDEVNDNYIKLAGMLLADGDYPAIASHDGVMIISRKSTAGPKTIMNSRCYMVSTAPLSGDLPNRATG